MFPGPVNLVGVQYDVRSNSKCICAAHRICCSPTTRLFTLIPARKSQAARQRSVVLIANKRDLPLAITIYCLANLVIGAKATFVYHQFNQPRDQEKNAHRTRIVHLERVRQRHAVHDHIPPI